MSVHYHTAVPATSANLGPGYDILGLALELYLTTAAIEADQWSLLLHGEGAGLLATDETNLLVRAYRNICEKFGWEPKPLAIECRNSIPVSRGLGSSASAIVTGMGLAQLVHTGAVDKAELLPVAADFEGHPDNVAPAVFGGLRAVEGAGRAVNRPVAPSVSVLVVVPPDHKSTMRLREVVPDALSETDQRLNNQYLSKVLEGLASGDPAKLAYSGNDLRHQPYRLAVQPSSAAIFEALQSASITVGAFLSGAGSTVAGWLVGTEDPVSATEKLLADNNIPAIVLHLQIDHTGIQGSITNE